jgi:hypothetical protein
MVCHPLEKDKDFITRILGLSVNLENFKNILESSNFSLEKTMILYFKSAG